MNDFDSGSSQILESSSPWLDGDDCVLYEYFHEFPEKRFKKGYVFYSQEENSEYVYFIHEGRVCLSVDNSNGEAKGIFIADKGFIFGKLSLFDTLPNSCCAIVVSDIASVIVVPKARFSDLLSSDPRFSQKIMEMMAKTIRSLISQIRVMTFDSAKAKVNYALYHLVHQYSVKEGDNLRINMTFTHQEIGELVGLSRVSVSNILSQMVKEGTISKKGGFYYVSDKNAIYKAFISDSNVN